jgi:hypothetical protein
MEPAGSQGDGQMIWMLVLNAVLALVTSFFAVVGLSRPGALSGSTSVSAGEWFYARVYAARGIPLGLLAAIVPFFVTGGAVALILLCAAVVQAADVAIAIPKRNTGMAVGAAVAVVVHCVTAFLVL